jgi:hypothetical protein
MAFTINQTVMISTVKQQGNREIQTLPGASELQKSVHAPR